MPKRRSRGEGSLYWEEARQRWVAIVTIGFRPNGKRIVRKRIGRTKTDAKNSLRICSENLKMGYHSARPQ